MPTPKIDRVLACLDEIMPNRTAQECWEWPRSRNAQGYGVISGSPGSSFVHRQMAERVLGPIRDGLVVLHLCDNPPCCNPDHLAIGTNAANVLDWHRKRKSGAA